MDINTKFLDKWIVDKILKYQEDKINLIKENTGLALMFKKDLLSRSVIENNLHNIIEDFQGRAGLSASNCIHCNIYNSTYVLSLQCNLCPINRNGKGCLSAYPNKYTEVQEYRKDNPNELLNRNLLILGLQLEVYIVRYTKAVLVEKYKKE